MKLIDLIEAAARTALAEQRQDGSLPAGNNGPHRDPETSVRNTAHWLVIFARLYRWSDGAEWRDVARRAADYLTSPAARPNGYAFHHRDRAGKDRCNGLIGAAWTFEGLVAAAETLADTSFIALAEEVFFQHPFDAAQGLWRVVEVDGRVLGFDATFNHQLWFAATAALTHGPRRDQILAQVGRFLDRCAENLTILPSGLVYHPIPPIRLATTAGARVRTRIKEWIKAAPLPGISGRRRAHRTELLRKSVGYHAFNLHAFGMLKQQLPLHPLWQTERFRRAVGYLESEEFASSLEDNPYGYPYNPPGFEVPFALATLSDLPPDRLLDMATIWVGRQFQRTLDPVSYQLARNNPDPVTLTARLYEAARLPDELLEGIEISSAFMVMVSTA
jgi:hypothetical protein